MTILRHIASRNARYLAAIFLMASACASSLSRVTEITRLAPPLNPQLQSDDAPARVTWKPSATADDPDFVGYNVYVSKTSLVFAAMKDHPDPLFVPKGTSVVLLENLEGASKYFITIRSINRRGELSLPSLPELILDPDKPPVNF